MSLKSIEDLKKFIQSETQKKEEPEAKNETALEKNVQEEKASENNLEKSVKEEKPALNIQPFMEKSTAILEELSKSLNNLEAKNSTALNGIVTSLEELNKSLEAKTKKADDLEKSLADVMKRLEALEKTPNAKKSVDTVEKNFEGNAKADEKKISKSQQLEILTNAALEGKIPLTDVNKFEISGGNVEFLSEAAKKLLG